MLFSLGSVFEDKDYAVMFAYGGYGYFDNMNAFFDANDYRSIDRRDIPSARVGIENVWGVADEHLFDQVLDEIDREQHGAGQPFFVARDDDEQPSPLHLSRRPHRYSFRHGRDGAVKYTDYAIGRFLARCARASRGSTIPCSCSPRTMARTPAARPASRSTSIGSRFYLRAEAHRAARASTG